MIIKLAILEKDRTYLNRIVNVFNTKYADKFEVYSFTDSNIAISTLESSKIDILLANEEFDIDLERLPRRCAFAYFVETPDVDCIYDQRAICKFQKADLIYKQILGVYAEKAGSLTGLKLGDDSAKVIAFSSVGGGTGASSMAAAAAIHFASQNKKTLYLNFEKLGSTNLLFSGPGQFDMSDVVFALKSRKANLSMKLESYVKQDESGVYFYSQPKVDLDMYELTDDDIMRMVSELKLTGAYDYIIADMDFSLNSERMDAFRRTHAVVWVGDGSELSNHKITRAYKAITIMEQDQDAPVTNRMCLIYNRFSNKSSQTVGDIGIRNIGGAPRYEHATTAQIIHQLSKMSIFDNII